MAASQSPDRGNTWERWRQIARQAVINQTSLEVVEAAEGQSPVDWSVLAVRLDDLFMVTGGGLGVHMWLISTQFEGQTPMQLLREEGGVNQVVGLLGKRLEDNPNSCR